MPGFNQQVLLPTGSNANLTSPSKAITPDTDTVGFRIVCEAIGATPAITWQVFASLDDANVPDANSFWDALGYVLEGQGASPDTVVFTSRSGPIVAGTAQSMWQATYNRRYRKYRVVTSGILNVTYRVEMFTTDTD